MITRRIGSSCGAVWILLAAALTGPAGCDRSKPDKQSQPEQQEPAARTIALESPAFGADQPIPRKYTGEGQDVSPPLRWRGLPKGTKQLALVVDDPDAPRPKPWVHWVIYGIPAETDSLPEAVEKTDTPSLPAGAIQGRNSSGKTGYHGPMPPRGHGVHHYRFRLYALDKALELKPGLGKDGLLKLIRPHVLGQGLLVGTYQR